MAYRKNNRGSWRIRANFKTVAGVVIGEVDVPLGTKDEALANKIEAEIRDLPKLLEHGAQLLCELRDKRRTGVEIYQLVKTQRVKDIPVILSADSLRDAWERQLDTGWKKMDGTLIGHLTLYEYRRFLDLLLEPAPKAMIRDLPRLYELYRDRTMQKYPERANTVKKVKAACLSFARNNQAGRKHSDLWRQISQATAPKSRPTNGNLALRFYEVREIISAIPDPRIKDICWAMALTGMSIGEYVSGFELHDDHVLIRGEKNEGRVRRVPRLSYDFKPQSVIYQHKKGGRGVNNVPGNPIRYEVINRAVNKASGDRCSSNVFRHCYAMWLQNCGGIPEDRQDEYRGHAGDSATKIRKIYTKAEWDTFVLVDTERLLEYIALEWERPKTENREIKRLSLSA